MLVKGMDLSAFYCTYLPIDPAIALYRGTSVSISRVSAQTAETTIYGHF